MRLLIVLATAFCLSFLASCGGELTPDAAADEVAEAVDEFVGVLAKITDKATAEEHDEDLKAVVQKMKDINARTEKLEDQAAFDAKVKETIKEPMAKLMKESTRLGMDTEIMAVIEETMAEMQKVGK
ncbi:MAG: hypothetical protein GY711_06975 [bacterium]|nr:hypothetical protein [bacterium]